MQKNVPAQGKKGRKACQAVSLVEIVLALALVSFLFLPIWRIFLHSTGVIRVGQHDAEILNIGLSFTAQIRTCSPTVLPSLSLQELVPNAKGMIAIGSYSIFLPSWDREMMRFQCEIKTFTVNSAPRDSVLVKAIVTWKEKMGPEKSFVFPVLLWKKGFKG